MKKLLCRALPALLCAALLLQGCGASPAETAPAPSAPAESPQEAAAVLPEIPASDAAQEPAYPPLPEEKPGTYILEPDEREAFAADRAAECSIPVIYIYTENDRKITSLTEYVPCIVDTANCAPEQELVSVPAAVRLRGNSSAYYGDYKKVISIQVPYRIRFEEKTNLLGLNGGARCRSWVLLKAEWELLRTDMLFRLGRAFVREGAFCSDGKPVFVYVNMKFAGIYELCEQNQVNKHRVNVPEPEEGDTGRNVGYYFEIDNYCEQPYFSMDYYGGAELTDANGVTRSPVGAEYSIKSDVYGKGQETFLAKYTRNVYKALYLAFENGRYYTVDNNANLFAADVSSPRSLAERLLNLDSAVDMYLIHEIAESYDCGEGSFYFCADLSEGAENARLTFTTPWDFGWAAMQDEGLFAGVFRDEAFVRESGDRSNPWFILLMGQDWFRELARERLRELVDNGTIARCFEEERDLLGLFYDDFMKYADGGEVNNAKEMMAQLERRIAWLYENL